MNLPQVKWYLAKFSLSLDNQVLGYRFLWERSQCSLNLVNLWIIIISNVHDWREFFFSFVHDNLFVLNTIAYAITITVLDVAALIHHHSLIFIIKMKQTSIG